MKFNNQYFILRHGETAYQTKKRGCIYPWPDNPSAKLTKKGEKEIKKTTREIKEIGIDLIYSSDILRTRQTAEIIAKELGFKINPVRKRSFLNGVNFDKRLRDVNLGIYHGKTKEEFYQEFPKSSKKRFYQRPKGGESWHEVKKRILSFIKEIDKKYRNKNILIISHGDPLWLLEGTVKGLTEEELLENRQKIFLKVGEFKKLEG